MDIRWAQLTPTTMSTLSRLPLTEQEIDALSKKAPHGQTPIWHYWEEFVERYLRTGKSEGTVKNVRDAITFVLRHTHLISIEEFNDQRLLGDALYKAMQERQFSHSTYNAYVKNLKTYFIWLERNGYVKEINIRKIERYTETPEKQTTLSIDQVNKVVGHIMSRRQTPLERCRNVFFIDLLRFTGARPAELLQLTEESIRSTKNGVILTIQGIKQKGKPRPYALSGYVKETYFSYMRCKRVKGREEKKLFVSASKREAWTKQGVNQLMKRLSNELGFRVNSYGFRRCVATTLDEQGLDLDEIGTYLGHTRRSTTRRYIEDSPKRTMKACQLMDKIY